MCLVAFFIDSNWGIVFIVVLASLSVIQCRCIQHSLNIWMVLGSTLKWKLIKKIPAFVKWRSTFVILYAKWSKISHVSFCSFEFSILCNIRSSNDIFRLVLVESRTTLLSNELKRHLFNLFASWSGPSAKPLGFSHAGIGGTNCNGATGTACASNNNSLGPSGANASGISINTGHISVEEEKLQFSALQVSYNALVRLSFFPLLCHFIEELHWTVHRFSISICMAYWLIFKCILYFVSLFHFFNVGYERIVMLWTMFWSVVFDGRWSHLSLVGLTADIHRR